MQDLNDLAWFVQVVDHGGFAAAGRALDQPKSKLSRRIAQLEERLGVRLIQRTTRQFAVTEVGHTFYQHCKAMLIEAEAAEQAVETLRSEPTRQAEISYAVFCLKKKRSRQRRREKRRSCTDVGRKDCKAENHA